MAVKQDYDDDKKVSQLESVDLTSSELDGVTMTVDAEDDAWERGVILPMGIYGAKPFIDRDGFKKNKETGDFSCGIEWKLVEFITHPTLATEFTGMVVQGGASTHIKPGKKTNTMATMMAKFGLPVGKLTTTLQCARNFQKFVAKELLTYLVLDWKAYSKEAEDTIFWSMTDFPQLKDGSYVQEGEDKKGRRFRAQLWVRRVIGKTLDGFDMEIPGMVVGGTGAAKKPASAPVMTTTVAPAATATTVTAKPATSETVKAIKNVAEVTTVDEFDDFINK